MRLSFMSAPMSVPV